MNSEIKMRNKMLEKLDTQIKDKENKLKEIDSSVAKRQEEFDKLMAKIKEAGNLNAE